MKVNIQRRCSLLLCLLHVKTTRSPACSFLMTRLTGELGDRHNVSKGAAQERDAFWKKERKKKAARLSAFAADLQVEFSC